MNKTLTSLVAGVTLVPALVGLSSGPAYAYPPGVGLSITTSVVPVPIKPGTFVVSVANAFPGCKVRVYIDESRHTTVADPDGMGQVTFTVKSKAGRIKIRAKTFSCKYKEKASTFVLVDGWKITGPGHAKEHKPFPVSVSNFQPNRTVTFLALHNGKAVKVKAVTDSTGAATANFKLDEGTWAIIATCGGRAASTKVKVSK